MTRPDVIRATLVLAGAMTLALPAFALTQWTVKPDPDAITWEGRQGVAPLNGRCSIFAADIRFDPAALDESSVKVVIDTGSCKTGDGQKDTYLPQEGWFNVAAFPQAVFEAKSFRHESGNNYVAEGTLTLKGVTKKVDLPFALTIAGDKAHVVGKTTLQRLAFGVGAAAQLSSPDVAGPDVQVKIDLHAVKG